MKIEISNNISSLCPHIELGIIVCDVENSVSNAHLWQEIEQEICVQKKELNLESINKRTEIESTRKVYKILGKDPNRYRPSAEALCRRILRDIPLYKVNTLVDIINMISIHSGYSIGAFDISKIKGDLILDVGTKNDEFDAIGRGLLNVEGIPIFRDEIGGIGTPTSDNERTKISLLTNKMLIIINNYTSNQDVKQTIDYTLHLLHKYGKMKKSSVDIVTTTEHKC